MYAFSWLAVVAACQPPSPEPPHTLPPIDDADPAAGFDAWAQIPPPPLTGCSPTQTVFVDATPYPDLPSASTAVMPGSTIWLCPGVHSDPVELTHTGPVAIAGMGGAGAVTIDGTGFAGAFVQGPRGVTYQVRDLTLMKFDPPYVGAIYPRPDDRVDLLRVRCEDSDIACVEASGTTYLRLRNVVAVNGTAAALNVFCDDFGGQGPCTVVVDDMEVMDFYSVEIIKLNGEGFVTGNPILTATIRDLDVHDNVATRRVFEASGHHEVVTLERATFRNNTIDRSFGGSCQHASALVELSHLDSPLPIYGRMRVIDSVFEDNQADWILGLTNWGPASGPQEYRAEVLNTSFRRNDACNSVVSINTSDGWSLRVVDSDFGTGADDNTWARWEVAAPCVFTSLGDNVSLEQQVWHGVAPGVRCR